MLIVRNVHVSCKVYALLLSALMQHLERWLYIIYEVFYYESMTNTYANIDCIDIVNLLLNLIYFQLLQLMEVIWLVVLNCRTYHIVVEMLSVFVLFAIWVLR